MNICTETYTLINKPVERIIKKKVGCSWNSKEISEQITLLTIQRIRFQIHSPLSSPPHPNNFEDTQEIPNYY